MRISDVASLLGLTSKDLIQEVENLRDELTAGGHKVAKRLSASSGLDDDAVRVVMARVDVRRQEEKRKSDEIEQAKQREEEEIRRRELEEKRRREDEERARQAEEARRRADEELERRRQEIARIAAMPAPVPPPAPEPAPVSDAGVPAQPVAEQPTALPAARPPQPQFPRAPHQPATRPQDGGVPQRLQPGARPLPSRAGERPQGPRTGERPSGPRTGRDEGTRRPGEAPRGGPRKDDARKGDKPLKRASTTSLEEFARVGMEATVTDDYKTRRRGPEERVKRPAEKKDDERRRKGAAKGGAKEKHSFRPTQIFNNEVIVRRAAPKVDRPRGGRKGGGQRDRRQEAPRAREVRLTGDFTVGQFAEKTGIEPAEIIKKLFLMGEMITINQVMNPDMAELFAAEFGVSITIERESDEFDIEEYMQPAEEGELKPRPPVVTIMGHVDHGKTTLLDYIRKANVVDSEAGGITQHIGAYYVTTNKGDIVFLDTPGHAAFTAMRARGANVTDLVVLVVAANDGVMPQTVEAINHAKAADVPIVVAINKMDVEGANPQRVKTELMRYEMVSEDLGGDTIMVEISAKKGTNVQSLLEMIALQAEVLELVANPDRPAIGTIIESNVDPHRGAVATVLVQEGTLRVGDVFVCGTEFGRIRAMRDDRGNTLEEAGPAIPVEILGLSGSPAAGEQFVVLSDETAAREIAEKRQVRRKARAAAATPHVTLDNLSQHLKEGEVKVLDLVIKGDVQGSVEAIISSLFKIKSDKVQLKVLHSGVGAITEGDVGLADASDAIIIGFNVRPDVQARDLAAKTGVQIKTYSIIYELLEEMEAAMLGMLEPVFEEETMSHAEVRQVFRIGKLGNIAGSFVTDGTIARGQKARLVRNGTVIWRGELSSLRRHKDDVKEVANGLDCGIGLTNYNDIKEGDIIETYVMRQLAATLVSSQPSGTAAS